MSMSRAQVFLTHTYIHTEKIPFHPSVVCPSSADVCVCIYIYMDRQKGVWEKIVVANTTHVLSRWLFPIFSSVTLGRAVKIHGTRGYIATLTVLHIVSFKAKKKKNWNRINNGKMKKKKKRNLKSMRKMSSSVYAHLPPDVRRGRNDTSNFLLGE